MEPTPTPTPTKTPDAPSTAPEATHPVVREHVVRTPGTCGGQPRIVGSRIRVKDVVLRHERMGQSPDQIVSEYPHLTLADIHAALAYYHDHREEMNADIRAEQHQYEQRKPARPSLLREKLERRKADAPDDPLPSR